VVATENKECANGGASFGGLTIFLTISPTTTLAVHCGDGFDAGFSPYRSPSLNR
jgi:hypothetical protein